MKDVLYFNGRFTTTDERVLGVEDRGFQFGDGVYEVMKFIQKTPIFVSDHYHRMVGGLRELEIPNPWTEEEWIDVLMEVLDRTAFQDGIVYVQVTRGEAERVHFYPENIQPTTVIYSRRYNFPDASKKERGFKLVTMPENRWKLCRVKSVNLLGNVIAKKKAQRAGAEEAIFIDSGVVREGASSTLFAVREGRLITHPPDACILPGTVRDRVISIALAEKIRVDERPLRDYELLNLEEAFITSTTQGVMPVSEIDGRVIGNGRRGEVTARLQKLFDELELQVGTGLRDRRLVKRAT
jgi:D-alanine transaminase